MKPLNFKSDTEELAHWQRQAEALNAAGRKAERREFLKSLALVATAPVAASGWAAWALSPRVEQDVEFIPIREDGTIARSHRLEDLPPEAQRDAAINTVIDYVRLREGYSSGDADYAYKVVSALSDGKIRAEYQAAHHPRNPEAPWNKYGTRTQIAIEYDSHDDLAMPTGYKGLPPGYAVYYWRTVRTENVPPVRELWRASVRIHRNQSSVSARERYEFNAGSILVWEYPAPYAMGSRGRG